MAGAGAGVPAGAIAAAGIGVYLNSFAGTYFLDDRGWMVGNPKLERLWPLRETIPELVGGGIRPLLRLSIAANWELGGEGLWGFHAFNLAVHILAALALFGVVRRTLLTGRLRGRFGRVVAQH